MEIEPRRLSLEEMQRLPDILALPEEQRTEEESALLSEFRVRQRWEKEEYDRQKAEADRQRKEYEEEGRRWTAEYIKKLRQPEPDRNSLAYFTAQLQRMAVPTPTARLADTPEQAFSFLAAAYQAEVQRMGVQVKADDNTRSVLQLAARWLSQHQKAGLMLRGNVGVGKTTLVRAIGRTLQIRLGQNLQVWEAPRIAALGKGKEGQAVLDELCRRPLLAIDDLGTEPLSVKDYGNDISPIIDLLTERYNRRAFTIITTNLAVVQLDGHATDEIETRYGQRIADRLRELCNTITYDGNQPSYRQ